MLVAEESLRQGNLDQALDQLQQQVRNRPEDGRLRVFLFQLLAVQGQWERALRQLAVAGQLLPDALPMVQTYREAIRCEVLRGEIFAGRRSPLIFGEPAQWIGLLAEALRWTAQGEHARARELREQALEAAPASSGRLRTAAGDDPPLPFAWIADADPRLGPVLEAVVNGHYYWIPLHRITQIELEGPADLRDLVWLPATLQWTNGGQSVALIPTRYPGSETSSDPQVRLSRKTDWQPLDQDLSGGLGQRLLATDSDDYPLLDLRHVELDPQPDAQEGSTGP